MWTIIYGGYECGLFVSTAEMGWSWPGLGPGPLLPQCLNIFQMWVWAGAVFFLLVAARTKWDSGWARSIAAFTPFRSCSMKSSEKESVAKAYSDVAS